MRAELDQSATSPARKVRRSPEESSTIRKPSESMSTARPLKTRPAELIRTSFPKVIDSSFHLLNIRSYPLVKDGISVAILVTIFETGKNTAIDETGNTWTWDREWTRDFVPLGKIDNGMTSHGYDRNHVQFETYKKGQELIAEYKLNEILDGKLIHNDELKESITFYGKFLSRSEDVVLQNAIKYEKLRAEQLFSTLFENVGHNHVD